MKHYKFGITVKTILFVTIPSLILVIFASIYAGISYYNVITDEIEEKLHTAAYGSTLLSESLGMEGDSIRDAIDDYAREAETEITIFQGDIRVVTTVDGALGTEMDATIKGDLISDNAPKFYTDANVNGEPYFGYYIPNVQDSELIGAMFSGMPRSEAMDIIQSKVVKLIASFVAIMIFSVCIALVLIRHMMRRFSATTELVEKLHNNDLTSEFSEYIHNDFDEYDGTYRDLFDLSNKWGTLIGDVKSSASDSIEISKELSSRAEVADVAVGEIAKAVENIAEGAQGQAEDVQKMVEAISVMGENIEKITADSAELTSSSESMTEANGVATKMLSELVSMNSEIRGYIDAVNGQIEETTKNIDTIYSSLTVIQEIATETNLLSLNASIEAARAGEAGRGFAVVAEQIKKLAEQSSISSQDIDKNLKSLLDNYNMIVERMKLATLGIGEQSEKLANTDQSFEELKRGVHDTAERIVDIVELVKEIDDKRVLISESSLNLSALSEENAAACQEVNANTEELRSTITIVAEKASNIDEMNEDLGRKLNVFKTK